MKMLATSLGCYITYEQYITIVSCLAHFQREEGEHFGGWPVYSYMNVDRRKIFELEY